MLTIKGECNMKKRVFAMMLAITMIASGLSGCSKEENVDLSLEEVLTALSICAVTNPTAQMAMDQLTELKDVQAHSTTMLTKDDEQTFRKLGIDVTCEPVYPSQKLYYV